MISARLARRDSLLFVYGTLRPFVDVEMAKWLRSHARYVGPANTRGRLYDLGAYPGMTPARESRERVVGDVYRVANPRVFRALDRYEDEFVRERCVVKLERGGCRVAWAYRYRYGVARAARIASGDYRVHRSSPSRS
jgi:gamma-glutamylcyclotransferase (GGCT)/AIG2-like uncharacterized protein YtfP